MSQIEQEREVCSICAAWWFPYMLPLHHVTSYTHMQYRVSFVRPSRIQLLHALHLTETERAFDFVLLETMMENALFSFKLQSLAQGCCFAHLPILVRSWDAITRLAGFTIWV